jgi:hypothetical protein
MNEVQKPGDSDLRTGLEGVDNGKILPLKTALSWLLSYYDYVHVLSDGVFCHRSHTVVYMFLQREQLSVY